MNQEQALEIMKMGHNVFLTGEAGSGKTYLLEKYIDYLENKGVKTAITASTGIAATHLDGVTIHSWAGIGVNNTLSDKEISNLLERKYLQKHFEGTEVLIIDEVSMLTAKQLDMIDRVCKAFKKNKLPFGGLQIILSGDFFQLPPVSSGNKVDFAFNSYIWEEIDLKICYLTDQFRQKNDKLQEVLSKIRQNKINSKVKKILQQRVKADSSNEDITKLYTHNKDINKINSKKLSNLSAEKHNYKMKTEGEGKVVDILKNNCLVAEELFLKKGALVMFIKNNFDKGYVNGMLGKVVDFENFTGYPVVELESGKNITVTPKKWKVKEGEEVKAEVKQIPLKLAWAITVHKSQGMSLDKAEIDLSKSFIEGMGYVALSRVKELTGIYLKGFNETSLKVNQDIVSVDKQLKQKSSQTLDALKNMDKEKIKNIQQDFIET